MLAFAFIRYDAANSVRLCKEGSIQEPINETTAPYEQANILLGSNTSILEIGLYPRHKRLHMVVNRSHVTEHSAADQICVSACRWNRTYCLVPEVALNPGLRVSPRHKGLHESHISLHR